MAFRLLALASSCACLSQVLGQGDFSVPPFTRYLRVQTPVLTGRDVTTVQQLLRNPPFAAQIIADGEYGTATSSAVQKFQAFVGLSLDGVVGPSTATALLKTQIFDGYKLQNMTAASMGYKYMITIPVHTNRSIETNATLYDANGAKLYSFRVRTHGHDTTGPNTWPTFDSTGFGLNQFSSDGNTPTGLFELDLNSPESEPKFYGPYPVNRVVSGLQGNGQWLIPSLRYGILIHTGEWAQYAGWAPPQPMPNSNGCVHTWPSNVHAIWQLLVQRCAVEVRTNPGGSQPYPFKAQGLLQVYHVQ